MGLALGFVVIRVQRYIHYEVSLHVLGSFELCMEHIL
jgi:hypothetical protein